MKLLPLAAMTVVFGVVPLSPSLAQSPPAAPEVPPSSCLSGYPDGTFRGDRPITRYEFAAGLNACLEQTLQQLEQADLATEADYEETLQRQQQLNEQLNELNGEIESRDRSTTAE